MCLSTKLKILNLGSKYWKIFFTVILPIYNRNFKLMEKLTYTELNLIKESLMYKKQAIEEYNYPSNEMKSHLLLNVETVIKKVNYMIKVMKQNP